VSSTTASGAVIHLNNTQRAFQISSRGNSLDFRDMTAGDARRLYISSTGKAFFEGDVDVASNITVHGTVDGRDVATDGTKLDTIATNADVTPSWVPSSDPRYGTSNLALGTTSTTALAGDTVTITTAQAAILTNLANLPTRRGASGTFWNNRGVVSVS
jgi:hypothetical protein